MFCSLYLTVVQSSDYNEGEVFFLNVSDSQFLDG